MAIELALGKLPLSQPYRLWMEQAIADLQHTVLPITLDHSERATVLPFHHRDPFDRMLAAQSLTTGFPLLGGDMVFDAYGGEPHLVTAWFLQFPLTPLSP